MVGVCGFVISQVKRVTLEFLQKKKLLGTAQILILGRLLPILTGVISIISARPVLDPLSCHATPGREGSRIICLRMLALNQLQRTLRQHVCFTVKSKNWRKNYSSMLQGKMSANEVTTPKKHVNPSLENCKVCGITTQINARAVISNPAGKTNL